MSRVEASMAFGTAGELVLKMGWGALLLLLLLSCCSSFSFSPSFWVVKLVELVVGAPCSLLSSLFFGGGTLSDEHFVSSSLLAPEAFSFAFPAHFLLFSFLSLSLPFFSLSLFSFFPTRWLADPIAIYAVQISFSL